ncbi:MAG: hypothetical protein ACRDZ8_18820 [Acidimicrobiales bacterium]
MAQTSNEALENLRDMWRANGQTAADIDEACGAGSNSKVCRNSVHMTFDGFADEETGDVRTGWQNTLDREGKRTERSLADVIFGDGPKPDLDAHPRHHRHN